MAQGEIGPLDSRTAAERAAKLIGCEGAHEMSGGWHPCESHEELMTLLNEGIDAYRELRDRKSKKSGKPRRRITWEELLEEIEKERPKKRRKRYTRWEHLMGREPSIEGGPPGITSGPPLGKAEKNTGIAVVLLPKAETAKPYLQEDGLPMEELHLTLGYFGKTDDANLQLKEDLVSWAWTQSTRCPTISADVNGVARMGHDNPQAVVLLLEDPKFQELREDLDQGYRATVLDRKYSGFLPHMTVSYGGSMDIQPADSIKFDHIGIWWGDERVSLPLLGKR